MNLLLFTVLVASLPALTVTTMKNCADKASWCQDYLNRCDGYPVRQHMLKFCKKSCRVCKDDGSCSLGYYGADCSPCQDRCKEGDCDKTEDTECPQGCPDGKRGINCSENCISACLNSCDRWNGDCLECEKGKYGVPQCKQNCDHCDDQGCDNEGYCIGDCVPGWLGDMCNIKVLDCDNTECSDHCNGRTCDQGSGACSNGCKHGYYGKKMHGKLS